MEILSIYYDHWGKEENRRRHHEHRLRNIRRTMSGLYTFSVMEADHDPRPGSDNPWGVLSIDGHDFWHHMRFVKSILAVQRGGRKFIPWQACEMRTLAHILFPVQSPPCMRRDDIGTMWEHYNRRRRRLCHLNGIGMTKDVDMETLERVDALICLPCRKKTLP